MRTIITTRISRSHYACLSFSTFRILGNVSQQNIANGKIRVYIQQETKNSRYIALPRIQMHTGHYVESLIANAFWNSSANVILATLRITVTLSRIHIGGGISILPGK